MWYNIITRRKWMEVIGIIGMTFGIIAWGLVANLRKEFEALKKNLEASGVLKELTKSENE